jgi:hypothetical protein
LRQSILNRIDELDKFYELNYLDDSIAIFHMVKLKLKKAIFKVPHINNESITLEFGNDIISKNQLKHDNNFPSG